MICGSRLATKGIAMKKSVFGFFGVIAIILVTLKLAEVGQVASWSWWFVLAPLYGPLALVIAIFIVLGIANYLTTLGAKAKRNTGKW